MNDVSDKCVTSAIEDAIVRFTSAAMHGFYCDNDSSIFQNAFDENVVWIGPGEDDCAIGKEEVSQTLERLASSKPPCVIDNERYSVRPLDGNAYLCTGTLSIATAESTNLVVRVRQRLTLCLQQEDREFRVCHIHASNPYAEMSPDDKGFPYRAGAESYRYLQELVEKQRADLEHHAEKLRAANEELQRISLIDPLTQLYNRHKFNYVMHDQATSEAAHLGIAYFDINGLKTANDTRGHRAGDELVCRAAAIIRERFPGKAFRIGGDEFVVIDHDSDKQLFERLCDDAHEAMHGNSISVAAGWAWREGPLDAEALFDEADQLMYRDKAEYYRRHDLHRR